MCLKRTKTSVKNTCKKTAKTSVKYCEKNIYDLELFIYLVKKAFKNDNEMNFF